MKVNTTIAILPLAISLIMGTSANAAEEVKAAPVNTGFEYTGYFRAGISTSASGGEQYCFGNGAYGHFTGRLGDECDSYSELGLSNGWKTSNGTVIKANTMLSVGTQDGAQGNDWQSVSEPVLSVPEGGSADIALRQLNLTATNVFESMPEATVWAGKRFYKRKQVETMDLYYLNNSGYGAGIEDIDLGLGDFSVAVVNVQRQQMSGRNNAHGERTVQNNLFDLRLDNIDLFADQKLDVAVVFSRVDSTDLQDQFDEPSDTGVLLTTELHGKFAGFDNHLVLQYGSDALADSAFENQSGLEPDTAPWWKGALESSTRFINYGHYDLTENVDLGYVFYASQGETIDSAVPNSSPYQRSIILSPSYSWDEQNKTVIEFGMSKYQTTASTNELTLNKIMIAHELSFDVGLDINPLIRAYTGAFFGDMAEQYREVSNDGEDGNIRFGIQAVANW